MSGVVVIKPHQRSANTAQTPDMVRQAGIAPEPCGSRGLWLGYVSSPPGPSGAHHHGDAESAIYMLSGRARFRWGAQLEHERIAGPGDFVYVPPNVVHAEENMSQDEPVVFVVSRNAGSMTTINVDIEEGP